MILSRSKAHLRPLCHAAALVLPSFFTLTPGLHAQNLVRQPDPSQAVYGLPALASRDVSSASASFTSSSFTEPRTDLPEAPEPLSSADGPAVSSSGAPTDPQQNLAVNAPQPKRLAPVFHRYIEPGEVAQRLTLPQQLVFGFAQSISPYFLLTVTGAAGYEQAVNGAPNYGSNFDAFGRRVGAAAIRNTSQSFFSDSLMASLLHEDPRFYVMGVRRSAFVRATYAASRVFVTRDADDGHLTPNYAQLSGYAEAAILTNAYYPAVNVHVGRTISSYGVSLGGSAISNVVREFYPSPRNIALRKRPE